MSYATRQSIEAVIPADFLVRALDDDGDGIEDAGLFASVQDVADRAVDNYLSARFTVPFAAPYPPAVSESARIFTCELLHERRGIFGEDNPFTKRAEMQRKLLTRIGEGDAALQAGQEAKSPPVALITEPAKTYSPNLNT